jgi:LysR family transcriptional activator of nhaA
LERSLGQVLFERRGRRLELTEAGRIAFEHAESIFRTGNELLSTLAGRPAHQLPVLRIGSSATLSRNFQWAFLQPLFARQQVQVRLVSGALRDLLLQLGAHALDLVLANESVPRDKSAGWHSVLLAQQSVSLVSRPLGADEPKAQPLRGSAGAKSKASSKSRSRPASGDSRSARRGNAPAAGALRFPQEVHGQALLLPGEQSSLRTAFDLLLSQAGVQPVVLAEVDDMAMLRLLARQTGALALVPPVVVRDELAAGTLVERCSIPQITERFYAITVQRRFPHPLLAELLERPLAGPVA